MVSASGTLRPKRLPDLAHPGLGEVVVAAVGGAALWKSGPGDGGAGGAVSVSNRFRRRRSTTQQKRLGTEMGTASGARPGDD